jgi:phenylpyruvate tautomerase PptA (4-oxalocrotonate tautomerase family)
MAAQMKLFAAGPKLNLSARTREPGELRRDLNAGTFGAVRSSMPSTTIEVRTRYSQEQEVALVDAVHDALVLAFKIPEHDKNVRLVVHEPHRFACPPNRSRPEAYTIVTVCAFPGRSLDAKRLLYRSIVERFSELGIPPDHVMIVLHEVPREDWGIRGGQAASDVELGFKTDV